MPKTPAPSNEYRSFTVRVPIPLYLEIAEMAREEETNLNKKANQLLVLGLGRHISLNDALRQLLIHTMTDTTEKNDG